MACRLAALASVTVLRSSASIRRFAVGSVDAALPVSSLLHCGQRFAKPGLSGFNSNSSSQTMQTLMGKAMPL